MKQLYKLFVISILAILTFSCQNDLWFGEEGNQDFKGNLISLRVDIPEIRTRVVDMTPGAALYLKNIWVGVYDVASGNKVGGTVGKIDLGNYLTASNTKIIDLVEISCSGLTNNKKYCVVGVVNYEGIKTEKGIDLDSALNLASTWSDFKDIAIDTQNSQFGVQTPLLMGFLSKENVSFQNVGYTKVDQFTTNENAINLYGADNTIENDTYITHSGSSEVLNTSGYLLKLRRLRSKINVIINTKDGVNLTNVAYKAFNQPKFSFLAQRRTNDFGNDKTSMTDTTYSPNRSDMVESGYKDDEEWITPPISYNFSFEHFENKHWAITDTLTQYHSREIHEGTVFKALASSKSDWNNNASYFVLKMNIRDENEGRNAEVEYTIHEGFINDQNGVEIKDKDKEGNRIDSVFKKRLKDFSCIRNTEYFYNITVNGVNDIVVQVTENQHSYDESGQVWQLDYVTDSNNNRKIEHFGSEDLKIERKVPLDPKDSSGFKNSDIAFRYLGTYYDEAKKMEVPVDLCYNFSRGDLDGFAGLWSVPTNANTEYIVSTGSGSSLVTAYEHLVDFFENDQNNAPYVKLLLNAIMVKYDGDYHTIKDYAEKIQADPDSKESPDIDGFKLQDFRYYEAYDPNHDNDASHVRGLYIFDREKAFLGGSRVAKDDDECSALYVINAIEQYPAYLQSVKYEMISASSQPLDATTNDKNYISFNDDNGKSWEGIILSEQPDFAFRICGYDGNSTDYYDIWYNLALDEYSEFTNNGVWPQYNLNSTLSTVISKGGLDENKIPSTFKDAFKIVINNTIYDIIDFIRDYENGSLTLTSDDKIGLRLNQAYAKTSYWDYTEKAYTRAFYLLDRKSKYIKPNSSLYNENTHNGTFQVYAIEQKPKYIAPETLKLPDNMPSVNYTATNFLDESIGEIKLPQLVDIDPADYVYQISVGSATGLMDMAPVEGYFTYEIPMSFSSGTGGSLEVQAIAVNEKYASSDPKTLGSVTLSNPSWDFTSQEWSNNFQSWTWSGAGNNKEFNHENKKYGYITFHSAEGSSNKVIRGMPGQGVNLRNSGTGCAIEFTVYKDCIINIKCTGEGKINMGAGEPPQYDVNATNNNGKGYDFKVTLGDDLYKEININSSSNSIIISSISLTPVPVP